MIDYQTLKEALSRELPGELAQRRMWSGHPSRPIEAGLPRGLRLSAVLVLIYPRDGQLWLPLTLRAETVASHKGQISLPGGQSEPDDPNLWQTALREAREELGLQSELVQYVGALTQYYIHSSCYEVHPYVGWSSVQPVFAANDEVAEIIEFPLAALIDPAVKGMAWQPLRGETVLVPCYQYQQHVIWGATAMILSELEAVVCAIRQVEAVKTSTAKGGCP